MISHELELIVIYLTTQAESQQTPMILLSPHHTDTDTHTQHSVVVSGGTGKPSLLQTQVLIL